MGDNCGQHMRILDRYIVREILLPFVIALVVLTFVLIIPFIIDLGRAADCTRACRGRRCSH